MLKGIYNKVKNFHALAALSKVPEVMGASLGMGDAESQTSIKINFNPSSPRQAALVKDIKTMNDTIYVGKGAQVKPEDFPKNYYMGEDENGN